MDRPPRSIKRPLFDSFWTPRFCWVSDRPPWSILRLPKSIMHLVGSTARDDRPSVAWQYSAPTLECIIDRPPWPINRLPAQLLLELNFYDTFVKPYHMELYLKPIQEFYMIKTSQRELIMMCIVIVDSMLKALKHTHILLILVDL